jgi:hypothetical protein
MEQKESTTQQKESLVSDKEPRDDSIVSDKSSTLMSSSSNWWGGWISQAKEKVRIDDPDPTHQLIPTHDDFVNSRSQSSKQ